MGCLTFGHFRIGIQNHRQFSTGDPWRTIPGVHRPMPDGPPPPAPTPPPDQDRAPACVCAVSLPHPSLEELGFHRARVIYVPCLAMAIGAANRNRWGIFAACACVAFSSRQSALAWFAIPAIAVLQSPRTLPGEWFARSRGPLLACLAGGTTWAACEFGMNQTHARQVMTTAMWDSFQLRSVIGWLGFALLLGLVCIGSANGLRWLERKGTSVYPTAPSLRNSGTR